MPFSLKSEAKRYQIALLAGALTAFAADLPRLEAGNCGCEAACGVEATCGCDQPVCSCQPAPCPACGVEAGCGVEVGCGVEPGCGCGAEVPCGPEAGCGVEMSYGEVACGAEAPCGCDACGQAKKKTNCLTKAMGSIKGSFQKMKAKMSPKKKPSCDVLCDDGCDAMMQGELMMPVPYETYGTAMSAPMPPASGPSGMALPHAATTLVPAPAAPHDYNDQRIGSGVVVPAPHAPQSRMNMGQPSLVPTQVTNPEPHAAPQHQDTINHEPNETDKLFDSVGDPFVDEQASSGRNQMPSVSRRATNTLGRRTR